VRPHLAVNDVTRPTSRGLGRLVEKVNDIHPCDLVSVGLLSTVVQIVYIWSTSLTNGVVLGNKPVAVVESR